MHARFMDTLKHKVKLHLYVDLTCDVILYLRLIVSQLLALHACGEFHAIS